MEDVPAPTPEDPESSESNSTGGTLRRAAMFLLLVLVSAGVTWAIGSGSPELNLAARRALFILVLAALLWITETVPAFAVGILVIALQIALLGRPGGVFASSPQQWEQFVSVLGHPLIWLFFGGFVMAAAMARCGLDRWIAQAMLRRFGSQPSRFLLGVMVVTFLLSMLISNTATTAMMLAVVGAHAAGRHERFDTGVLLGIAVAANLGGMGSLIGTPPNAIAVGALAQAEPATTVSFLQWLLIGLAPAAISTFLLWLVLARVYRSPHAEVQLETHDSGESIDRGPAWYRPAVAGTILATVALWLTSQWHGIPTAAVSFLPIVVFTTTGILSDQEIRGLSYDVLFLMAGGLALGQIVTDTGLSTWIVDRLPLGGLGDLSLAVIMTVVAVVFSNLMSNTATANLLMPLAVTIAPQHAATVAIPIAFGCSAAMMLPVATPPNAMVYATGRCGAGELRKIGLVVALLVPLLGILWLRLVLPWVLDLNR